MTTKRVVILLGIVTVGLLAAVGARWFRKQHAPLPLAAEAVRQVHSANARPVTERELAGNELRRAAGLREISPRWFIAPTKHFVCDGPEFRVVLNEQRQPVSVLSLHTPGWPPVGPVWTEYEVRDGALNGLSATWWGTPPQLYETMTYRQNQRHGPTVCFGSNGIEIARCEYRQDKPWTGRMLQRQGFAPVLWDVSYRDGLLSGEEILFETDGTTNRLRTFCAGVEHGVQRRYYLGVLRSEETLDSGRRISHRSWHPNGQLEWSETYDSRGRQHGVRQHWDTNGALLATERYEHGREQK